MENTENVQTKIDFKEKLVQFYQKGTLSYILLTLLLALIGLLVFQRVSIAHLLKELSIVPFNLKPNLNQDYGAIITFNTFTLVLIILIWIVILLYFLGWYYKEQKIQFNALVVYTLLGFLITSGAYLILTQPLSKEVTTLNQIRTCEISESEHLEKPLYCKALMNDSSQQLNAMGTQTNETYFWTQTSMVAIIFFSLLSILQLVLDKSKRLILIRKIATKGGHNESSTL